MLRLMLFLTKSSATVARDSRRYSGPNPILINLSCYSSGMDFRPFGEWAANRLAYGGCPSAKFA